MADSDSDASSELTFFSRSPSPVSAPASQLRGHLLWPDTAMHLPSPPGSQASSCQTPDDTSSGSVSSVEDGDERPAKRRRVSPNMPRDTKWLDLARVRDLDSQAQLDRLVKAIKTKRKIVVVAGAGISVSAGIPDFRSSAGLFNSLKAQHNLKGSGKQLFDADVYRDSNSTSSFHQMVRQLSTETKVAKPTRFHHLLASLAQEGRLLRLYTQNVDGIDTSLPPLATQVPVPSKAPWPKTIQLHGGLSKMVCTKCGTINDFDAALFDGPIPPECKACVDLDDLREVEGKRSHGVGKLRPRMVLYNEGNPDDEAIGSCVKADLRRRPDCIIVVGTTLKVPGIKRIVREMTGVVRDHRDGVSVWINNDPEPSGKEFENSWDIVVKGTSDQVARHAGLRQWDVEEAVIAKEVSEDEVKHIKNVNGLKVIVDSPTKNRCSDSLPTPVDSPRPGHVSLAAVSDTKVKKLTLFNAGKSTTSKLPASKGKTIDDILGPVKSLAKPSGRKAASAATKEGPIAKARPTKSAAAAKATVPRKRALKAGPVMNGMLEFQITKGNPSISPLEPTKEENKQDSMKKPEPLTAPSTRENVPFPAKSEVFKGEV